jgi:prevent-host-death family protein
LLGVSKQAAQRKYAKLINERSELPIRRVIVNRSTPCYGAVVSRTITQRELRNDSGEIMRSLDQGESFIVTRNGTPVGELTPLRRHRFVSTDTVVAMFRHAPSIDARRFRDDLDAGVDQDSTPRG